MQLEEGPNDTEFEYREFGEELALCQRYYEKSYDYKIFPGATSSAGNVGGHSVNGTNQLFPVSYAVPKRVVPTTSLYSPATGAVGAVRKDNSPADIASSPIYPGISGFGGVSMNTIPAVNNTIRYHYTSDAEL